MVISLFKGRVRTKLQKAFDMWSEYTRILNKDNLMRHQLLQLRVGLQHVESETSNKKALEDNSIRLQTLLLMTLYFFKWKSTSSLILLNEERYYYHHHYYHHHHYHYHRYHHHYHYHYHHYEGILTTSKMLSS